MYNISMENDITGNRDAAYSKWHRRTLPKKHTLIDNDLFDLSNSFVYTMYYNWDREGDLIPQVTFETKGIIKDENNIFILPDLTRFRQQILALRGTAKGNDNPAFMVFYYIKEVTFFTVVPLNLKAKKLFGKKKYRTLTERQYISLLKEVTGMSFQNTGSTINFSTLLFKDTLFKDSLDKLNLN
jgi:hypothetical protein